MNTHELRKEIRDLLERLEADGYSAEMRQNARWVLRHFYKFCVFNGIEEIGPPAMEEFLRVQYDLEIDAADVTPAQCVVRKPLLTLWELHTTGTYLKSHQRSRVAPPEGFEAFYLRYEEFVRGLGNSARTVDMKLGRMRRFLEHLRARGLRDVGALAPADVHAYVGDGEHSCHESKRDAYYLREALDWMRDEGVVPFGGRDVFPKIRARRYSPVPSRYTSGEVARVLASIDVSTAEGKRDMLVCSLFAHYGMRCGDVAKLELGDIDWAARRIRLVQDKTGLPLELPLIEEVELPLADYLRNARPESDDPHVLLTTHAPHTPYKGGSALYGFVRRAIERAGIDPGGRRRGPHALRHSLASAMLDGGVPLPTIGAVLGHAGTSTTEAYLSIDESRLAELALEVPDVGRA